MDGHGRLRKRRGEWSDDSSEDEEEHDKDAQEQDTDAEQDNDVVNISDDEDEDLEIVVNNSLGPSQSASRVSFLLNALANQGFAI